HTGALVTSNNPIAMVNGFALGNLLGNSTSNQDAGFDQAVPVTRVGQEYVVVKGNGTTSGTSVTEQVLIVAHYNNTQIFVNGSATPLATLNAGDYRLIPGTYFTANNNMYIYTSRPAYCYQHLAVSSSASTGGYGLVAPLSCRLGTYVSNIPSIHLIGNSNFNGGLFIVTRVGSTVTVTDGN